MNNDSNIARAMCLVPHHMMLAFMQGNHNKIIDDSAYWNMLGTAWKAGGCFKDQNDWMVMFRSKRRNRQKIMKSSERREFARLPKKLKAYRAYADPIEIEQSVCWSLDKKFVEQYAKAKDLQIAECTFNRDDVFAYFNRRRESEILVWRGGMNTKKEEETLFDYFTPSKTLLFPIALHEQTTKKYENPDQGKQHAS